MRERPPFLENQKSVEAFSNAVRLEPYGIIEVVLPRHLKTIGFLICASLRRPGGERATPASLTRNAVGAVRVELSPTFDDGRGQRALGDAGQPQAWVRSRGEVQGHAADSLSRPLPFPERSDRSTTASPRASGCASLSAALSFLKRRRGSLPARREAGFRTNSLNADERVVFWAPCVNCAPITSDIPHLVDYQRSLSCAMPKRAL